MAFIYEFRNNYDRCQSRALAEICFPTYVAESQASIRSRMKSSLLIFGFGLLCNPAKCTDKCESHDLSEPFHGRYCPKEGIITPNLSWHQCKLLCLHKSTCQAVNYDPSANLCIHFIETCPLAISHPNMAFVLFTERQADQCMEWVPIEDGNPARDRSVTVDNERFAARMQNDGTDFIGFFRASQYDCYSRHDEGFKNSDGYPCQYLRIRDGCTVYFVDYEIGTPLPHNAMIGGYTAVGLPVYIGCREIRPGYYIPGSSGVIIYNKIVVVNVKILVLL